MNGYDLGDTAQSIQESNEEIRRSGVLKASGWEDFDIRTDLPRFYPPRVSITVPATAPHEKIASIGEKTTIADTFILFYGGHGVFDHQQSYWLTAWDSDTKRLVETALSFEIIQKNLSKIPGRVLVLLDSCHSGLAAEGGRRYGRKTIDDVVKSLTNMEVYNF